MRYRHAIVRKNPVPGRDQQRRQTMNSIIYIVGLVVVVLFILSFLGLR
ncbi:hypothetical protein GIY56_01255 [Paracoccus sp. YIM 132242]|uniref:Uncharacterized protein n=1 Tax=Paracoccus lichenicola TaxID=2665644 RepID=A0A6L6HKG5_9RHOB|nr:hypothetical protein [Paracoccus lichenicola]